MGEKRVERLNGPKSVKIIGVIEVKAKRGLGIAGDPVREITQYWDMEGNFLAEKDSDAQFISDQIIWESNRLKSIVENYSEIQKLR